MHRKVGARVVVEDMYDWVHVNEKWFYVMKDGRGIYLHPEEDTPKPPRAQNKRFITKVTFLADVARPWMISDGVWLDGKIVIWPIADTVAAMRSSKNRKKGTVMLKPATDNTERYKKLMVDKVIPAIKARMPTPPVTRSSWSRMVQRMVQSRPRRGGLWRQFRQRPGKESSWTPSLPTHLILTS
ncbi:unnamed protein product [Discosporangium mesarthrocarpum]